MGSRELAVPKKGDPWGSTGGACALSLWAFKLGSAPRTSGSHEVATVSQAEECSWAAACLSLSSSGASSELRGTRSPISHLPSLSLLLPCLQALLRGSGSGPCTASQ